MGEFARVIQPHLDEHGIEGPEDLARKIRVAGVRRCAPEVRAWMEGEPRYAGFRDLDALSSILNLNDEETYAVEAAFCRDARTWVEARRREQ